MLEVTARDLRIARAFLAGAIGPIEVARELSHLDLDGLPQESRDALLGFMVVDSETDAIPIGALRDQWHPSVRAEQDEKHDHAVEWARPIVAEACRQLISLAESPLP